MRNPIFNELRKLNLISKKNLKIISSKTRDSKINVIKDMKTKIIFLEKFITNNQYYSSLKYTDGRKIVKNTLSNISEINTSYGKITTILIDDNIRRAKQFQKILKNKDILDFGCGRGEFLKNVKKYKSLNGIELRKDCLDYINSKIKRINISNNLSFFEKKFDVITMFHVLEHIPYQVQTLKKLRYRLKKNGKIIIEVPHAEDFLILQDELKEFKDFSFWSEHLILHTYKSLKKVLIKSGFKKIKIEFYQRYNFSNHLGWFLKRKPNGHNLYKKIVSEKLNKSYTENLIKLGQTDTLIAIAE